MTPHSDRGRGPGPSPGRLLVVGAQRRLGGLTRLLDERPWSGLRLVGFVDVSGRGRQLAVHPAAEPVPILGRVDRLAELVERSRATDLVVALSGRSSRRLGDQLADLSGSTVRVHWVADDLGKGRAATTGGSRADPGHRPPASWHPGRAAKRLLDFVGALAGLIALSPFLAGVVLAIWLTSGRPIFYTQTRIGRGGRPFPIWKFRSMRLDAEASSGPIWASFHDDRCTPIGEWLRRTNVDELPQLINVLRGDMSLVGPRPERPVFVDQFRAELPEYDLRHSVPAGMTGWAQVHGWRGRTSLRKRLQYDLDYIRRWSFWLDVRILFMTVQHVLWSKIDWAGDAKRRPEREPARPIAMPPGADALGGDPDLQRPRPAGDVSG